MNELDAIRLAVLAYLGYGAARIGTAPVEATYEVVKGRVQRRLEWIIDRATQKAGRDIKVTDRIAFKAMSEGAFTDDEVAAEYLAGVLAASGPDDDSGAAVVALIGRLSAVQLRFHYLLYRELRRLWPPDVGLNLYQEREANKAGVRLPLEDLFTVFGNTVTQQIGGIQLVLKHEGLIGDTFQFGRDDAVAEGHLPWSAQLRPTGLGAELFLWGHGSPVTHANTLLKQDLELTFFTDVPSTPGATLLTPPTRSNDEGAP